MKLSLAFVAATAASVLAAPSPLIAADVAKTVVDFDESRSALDAGAVQFSVFRTDDLVDIETHTLLAERLSHVAVRIQLDQAGQALLVNDQAVPLNDHEEQHSVGVSIIKSDALLLPANIPSTVLATADELDQAVASMSPGIVSLEVRVESEVVNAGIAAPVEGEMRAMVVDGLRLRRIGVFIKINEIEGVDFEHSSLVYAPILQLLVSSQGQNGEITSVKTLSVNGEAPTEDAPAMPGIAMVNDMLPPVEDPSELAAEPQWHPHRQHHGVFGWLANMLGLSPSPPHRRHPCPGKFRKGLAAASPQMIEDHFEGETGDASAQSPHHPKHHGKHHGHHMRHRNACFFRRFVSGVSHVFGYIWNSLIGQALLGFLTGGILFHVVRRIKHRCNRHRYAAVEAELTRDVEVEKKVMDELVYVDELPRYEPVAIIVEEVKEEK